MDIETGEEWEIVKNKIKNARWITPRRISLQDQH
jgi:hypothetical protein